MRDLSDGSRVMDRPDGPTHVVKDWRFAE